MVGSGNEAQAGILLLLMLYYSHFDRDNRIYSKAWQ